MKRLCKGCKLPINKDNPEYQDGCVTCVKCCKKCEQPLILGEIDEGICNGCDSEELAEQINRQNGNC